jgi:hypothetical protein
MTTLLRKTDSGLYNQGPDKWTKDPVRALDFRFIDLALRYAKTWSLRDVELAFMFDNPNEVTGMPLERAAMAYWLPDELTGSD